jgi:hypothetical protein
MKLVDVLVLLSITVLCILLWIDISFPFPPQAAEYHLVDLFQNAHLCAIHANRVTISKLSPMSTSFLLHFFYFLVVAKETCQSYESLSIT